MTETAPTTLSQSVWRRAPNRLVVALLGLLALIGAACGAVTTEPTPTPPVTPADQPLQQMVRDVVLTLNQSVKDEDFTALFDEFHIRSQVYVSPDIMQKTYQRFIDDGVDLSAVATTDAVFNGEPRRERRGLVLVISGHYPLPAGKVPFQVRYWYRDNGWGLHAVLVRAPGSSDIPLPPDREPEFTR